MWKRRRKCKEKQRRRGFGAGGRTGWLGASGRRPGLQQAEGGTGHPGRGLAAVRAPPPTFFPTLLVLKVSAAFFSGGLAAPCSSGAESRARLMAVAAFKKPFAAAAAGRGKLGTRCARSTARAAEGRAAAARATGRSHGLASPATRAGRRAGASPPERPRLRIPRGRRDARGTLGWGSQGWRPSPGRSGKFWPEQTGRGGLRQATRARGVQDPSPPGREGFAWALGTALGTGSSLGPAARPAVPRTVCCHRVSPSVSGHPWRFGRTRCHPSPPFLFLLLILLLQCRSSSLIFAESWLADLSLSLCLCLCLSLYVL